MSKTIVVHVRQPHDVKICRLPNGSIPPVPQSGCFGNPFILHDVNDNEERAKVIASYRQYFHGRILHDPAFKAAVLSLRGKRLACFCAPKPCHGDVIVEWLEGQCTPGS